MLVNKLILVIIQLIVLVSLLMTCQAASLSDYSVQQYLEDQLRNAAIKRFRSEPVRFGKRSPREPIRFGKRREPVRFGKRREPVRFGKRIPDMASFSDLYRQAILS